MADGGYKKGDVIYQGTVALCRRFMPAFGDRIVDHECGIGLSHAKSAKFAKFLGGIIDASREGRDVREVYRRDSCARTLAPFALRKLLALLVGQPDGFAAGELTRDVLRKR